MRRGLRNAAILSGLGVLAAAAAWLATGGWGALRAVAAHGRTAGRSEATRPARPLDALRPAPAFGDPPPPGCEGASRVLARLEAVERRTRRTRYRHRTRVDVAHGIFEWDCSGMAGWVLRRETPRAARALGRPRPIARSFARTIARAPTDRARRGWRRIDHIGDALPGDVFAWERPPGFRSRNSGHVGFVVNRPVRLTGDLWAVRILDSTSAPHQDDTRRPGSSGGTGRGTMTFLTDSEGHATAYGWHGTRSLGYVETPILFGRPER